MSVLLSNLESVVSVILDLSFAVIFILTLLHPLPSSLHIPFGSMVRSPGAGVAVVVSSALCAVLAAAAGGAGIQGEKAASITNITINIKKAKKMAYLQLSQITRFNNNKK